MELQDLGQPAVALSQGNGLGKDVLVTGVTRAASQQVQQACCPANLYPCLLRAPCSSCELSTIGRGVIWRLAGQAYKAIPFRHSMSVQCPIGWGTGLAWQVHKTALFLHSVFHLLASAIGRGAAGPDPMPLFKPVTGAWADEDESDGMEALEGGHGCMSPDWMQVRSYR
eukprot:scaffold204079_cov23-Tisochrysis_lutea.AAC.2